MKVYEPEEMIRTAEEAGQRARDEVLFEDEMILDREEITNTTVRWVDKMDVEHVEGCPGKHCKHYGCGMTPDEIADDTPWFCTQCDPASYT